MIESYQQINPYQYPSQGKETYKFETDLSEKYDKAKNKAIYAAIFSIIVGIYSVNLDTNLLGLKLENLTDRRLEWSAWIASVFFFTNATFRFFDERRDFEMYKNAVIEFRNEFSGVEMELLSTVERILKHLEYPNGELDRNIDELEKRLKRLEKTLSKFIDNNDAKETVGILINQLTWTKDSIDTIRKQNVETLEKIKDIPNLIAKFQKKTKPVKTFRNIAGIRFVLFDVCVPFILMVFVMAIHFSPEIKQGILDLVPEVTEKNKAYL